MGYARAVRKGDTRHTSSRRLSVANGPLNCYFGLRE